MSEPGLDGASSNGSGEPELRDSVSRLMRGLNHDLKNPLGAADGYLDLMLQGFRGDLTDEQRQTLERIRVLIASGIDILEDVVTFTRASLGELRMREVDSDVSVVTRMAMERHQARAQEAGVALEFSDDDGKARTVTDPDLVGQIVDRLVANALDHTPDGGRIEVRVAHGPQLITIEVSDSGPGIRDEDAERVFLEFERGPAPTRARVTSGIGFGLPLARALANRLDGSLELRNDSDGGATFRVELPVRRGDVSTRRAAATPE